MAQRLSFVFAWPSVYPLNGVNVWSEAHLFPKTPTKIPKNPDISRIRPSTFTVPFPGTAAEGIILNRCFRYNDMNPLQS